VSLRGENSRVLRCTWHNFVEVYGRKSTLLPAWWLAVIKTGRKHTMEGMKIERRKKENIDTTVLLPAVVDSPLNIRQNEI